MVSVYFALRKMGLLSILRVFHFSQIGEPSASMRWSCATEYVMS